MTSFNTRRLGALGGVLVLGILAVLLAGPRATDTQATAPSYEALRALYQDGTGKGLDDGYAELLLFQVEQPTGWVWVIDDISDGDGEEYLIKTGDYMEPQENDPASQLQRNWLELGPILSVEQLLDWIIENYDHVTTLADLEVEHVVVTAN